MTVQIQLRRGTAAEWTVANPTLALAEMGIETNTQYFKIGDGSTPWNSLLYGGIQGYVGSVGYTGSAGIGYTGSASTAVGYTGSAGIGYTGSASTVAGYTGSIGYTGSVPDAQISLLIALAAAL